MCYGISRRFSCCDFLGQWNFSYEVIVNVDLLSAVSAGLVRRINDNLFNQFMEYMAYRLRHHIGVPAIANTAIDRRELFGRSDHVPSVPTAAKVDKSAYQVNNIIPNSNDTVKKSNFFAIF